MSTGIVQAFAAATAAHRKGRVAEAVAAYRDVVARAPAHVDARMNLGELLATAGRHAEAAEEFAAAVRLKPTHARAHYNLAVTYAALGRARDAIVSYRSATACDPRLFQAHANLGVLLHDDGALDEAEVAYRKALAINPNDQETLNNLAVLCRDRGQFADAAGFFDRAINVRPMLAEPHRNKALMLLLTGNYASGWAEYEWRWSCKNMSGLVRPFSWPRWRGEPLGAGESLLVWGEQGLGDEILFAGMLDDLVARGLSLVWEADARLVGLLQRSNPLVRVIPRQSPPADELQGLGIAAQCPAGSLGQYFRSSGDAFPGRPRYLSPDAERVADMRRRIAGDGAAPLVGVSWLSRNPEIGRLKSTVLEDWSALLKMPGVRFVDLQYGDTAAERAKESNGRLIHIDDLDLTADLDGVAALIAACNVVLTVSNTVAHLAGALGVSTWVLVPAAAGKLWYWGNAVQTSPWYPSVRIIRPPQSGGVTAHPSALANQLAAFLGGLEARGA
jgi:Flp pilus assembly protein TadD